MVEGIILAGGYSSRTNQNKMLLEINGLPLILHTINSMKEVCEKIIVVSGFYHDDLKLLLSDYDYVQLVFNPNFSLGMFSSIITGVKQTNDDFFIIPGDIPLVKKETYLQILNGNSSIRVPSYNKHLGHPIFISQALKQELLSGNYSNLKEFRNKVGFEYIEVDDPNILMDLDTLDDYKKIKERI